MKGFIVINRINDVFFIDSDKEFADHINNQAREQGLIQDDDDGDTKTIDTNIVMQLFSPLFMSQWFLIDHNKNPCSSITCENGFIFVFKQHEDLLFMAINGDHMEDEELLHRKVAVFIRLTEFLFGPVTEEIGYSKFVDRRERWSFLRGILSTWSQLVDEEQAFLVEAIERLHVNQMVNSRCMDVLESAVNKVLKAGEKFTHHAMIVVNSKLLSLYSDRRASELQAADIMSIIVLVRQMFPTHEKLEDFFAFSYRKPDENNPMSSGKTAASANVYVPPRDRYESALEGDDEDSYDTDEHYLSARDTPPGRHANREAFTSAPESPYPQVSEHTQDEVFSPVQEVNSETNEKTLLDEIKDTNPDMTSTPVRRERSRTSDDVHKGGSSWRRYLFGTDTGSAIGRSRSRSMNAAGARSSPGGLNTPEKSKSDSMKSLSNDSLPPEIPDDQVDPNSNDRDYLRQPCFLCTESCQFSPHQLHCMRIFPGMVLVIVSQVPFGSHANKLCQLFMLFKDLLSGRKARVQRTQGQELYDLINTLINKLTPIILKAKGNVERIFNDIKKRWDKPDFKNSFLAYLEQAASVEIPPSVERALIVLLKKVKELFLYMYLLPRSSPTTVSVAIQKLIDRAQLQLKDFKDYLSVKAQRNITMTTYLDMFPGLIHFIYIDRRTNQVMAPSLNITQGEQGTDYDATQLLKEKIWKMTKWMQQKIKKGVTMVTAREGDYHYSYFLWFEDCNGTPLPAQQPFTSTGVQPPPGILSGHFYRNLTRALFPNVVAGSVNCYELMMLHIGLVHTQYVVEHSHKLTRMMWEISGDAYSPMSLVW